MHFQMERGRIYLMQEGKLLAELTYTDEGDYYNVDHTFVDECLRGQGVAAQLMAAYQSLLEKEQRKRNCYLRKSFFCLSTLKRL